MTILEIKSGIGTKEFTLAYSPKKDVYYLDTVAYGEWQQLTFPNKEKLEDWLKDIWSFDEGQINSLYDVLELV